MQTLFCQNETAAYWLTEWKYMYFVFQENLAQKMFLFNFLKLFVLIYFGTFLHQSNPSFQKFFLKILKEVWQYASLLSETWQIL